MISTIKQGLSTIYAKYLREKKNKRKRINAPADFKNNNYIIEILGPSGIGKSHYLKRLREFEKNGEWMTTLEFINLLRVDYVIEHNINSEYKLLLDKALERISNSGLDIYDKYKMFGHFKNITEYDYRMKLINGDGRKVVVDEGLYLNYYKELLELSKVKKEVFEKFIINRAFIFLEASPDFVLKNIRKRETQGKLMELHSGLDDQGIKDYTQKLADKFAVFQSLFDTYNVPYLKINAEDELQVNVERISRFVKEIGG